MKNKRAGIYPAAIYSIKFKNISIQVIITDRDKTKQEILNELGLESENEITIEKTGKNKSTITMIA